MRTSRGILVAAAGVISVCVAVWSQTGDQTHTISRHLLLYAAAFGAYLTALWAGRGLSRGAVGLCIVVAIGWRAALVAAPPLLSDDINRYVWEGRIQRHGGNPYAWADRPEAEKWVGLRDEVWGGVNHKDYTAVYPPLFQLASRAVVTVHDSVTAMKAFLVICELAGLWVLSSILRRRGLARERLLVAAWSPLALVEIAGSGHNEPLGLLLLLVGLQALEAGKPLGSILGVALGVQAKLLPGLVALAWARRYRPWHLAAGLSLAAGLVLPYADAGMGLLHSLSKYAQFWRFNETLFAPLVWVTGAHLAAVRLAAAAVALLAAGLAWRRVEPVSATLVVLTAWIALNPSMLPWYALWLVPLLALRDAPPLLLFTGTVSLAYLVYPGWQSDGVWQVGWGIRGLEYGSCLCVAVAAWLRARARP